MLMFWVIVALIATYERYIELACTWLPFYWETKVVLLLLIFVPRLHGAKWLFQIAVDPLIEAKVNQWVPEAQRALAAWGNRANSALLADTIDQASDAQLAQMKTNLEDVLLAVRDRAVELSAPPASDAGGGGSSSSGGSAGASALGADDGADGDADGGTRGDACAAPATLPPALVVDAPRASGRSYASRYVELAAAVDAGAPVASARLDALRAVVPRAQTPQARQLHDSARDDARRATSEPRPRRPTVERVGDQAR